MSRYIDVPPDRDYYDAVEFVSDLGCMEAFASGNFEPNRYMKYIDVLISLSKFLGIEPAFGNDISLPDLKNFEWCKEYVYSCVINNICSLSDISHTSLARFVDWDTVAKLLENAKGVRPLLDPPVKLSKKDVPRIPRALWAYFLYLSAQKTAPNVLEKIISFTNNWPSVSFLLKQYNFSLPFLPSDIVKIFNLIQDIPESRKQVNYSCLIKIYSLKKPFQFPKSSATSIYHYTSLQALEKLTQPGANFRLSNTAYLNDPEEGKLARQVIPKILEKYKNLDKWSLNEATPAHVATSNTFIASFMENKDRLEMWAQYGAGGAGCCLGLQSSVFDGELYSVFYEIDRFSAFFDNLCSVLDKYIKEYPDTDVATNPVFSYAYDTVNQVSFLYKDKAYDYEKEVRILSFCDPRNAQAEAEARPGEVFPRLYIEAAIHHEDERLPFSSILLGPKVQDPEKIAVSLVHRGYDNAIIRKSTIKFR